MGILIRRRKTETVTITHEFLKIHGRHEAPTAWCQQCSQETKLVLPEQAAILTGISAREIYRRLEIGRIHFIETSMGSLLICLNSVGSSVDEAANDLKAIDVLRER
jgi:hypothetical protein